MKKLILDYSKWRCGENGSNQLGQGDTYLLNEEGFQCCLGQFSTQLSDEVNEHLLGEAEPSGIPVYIPDLNRHLGKKDYINTNLSNDAININDDVNTSPDRKIALLKRLFGTKGYEIEVINHP